MQHYCTVAASAAAIGCELRGPRGTSGARAQQAICQTSTVLYIKLKFISMIFILKLKLNSYYRSLKH